MLNSTESLSSVDDNGLSRVPIAILPYNDLKDVEDITLYCGKTTVPADERSKTSRIVSGLSLPQRMGIDDDDNDPPFLVPEAAALPRLIYDFVPPFSMDNTHDGLVHAVIAVIVNKLDTPLTVMPASDGAFHGDFVAKPSVRTWDSRHEHYEWEDGKEGWTIPAGNKAQKLAGVGVFGIKWRNGLRGCAAGVQISSDNPNLPDPLWFVVQDAYGSHKGRYLTANVTDDLAQWRGIEQYYENYCDQNRASWDQCAMKKGQGLDADANYTATCAIARMDPAPPGSGVEVSKRKYGYTSQAILVIDTEVKAIK